MKHPAITIVCVPENIVLVMLPTSAPSLEDIELVKFNNKNHNFPEYLHISRTYLKHNGTSAASDVELVSITSPEIFC